MKNYRFINKYGLGTIITVLAAAFFFSSAAFATTATAVYATGRATATATASSPLVYTGAATSITTTSAILSGTYDTGSAPGGASTRFSWGTDQYTLSNTTSFVADTNASDTFTATLTGLTPNTTYYYRAFANNTTTGPGYGITTSFKTLSDIPTPPTAVTLSETNTTSTATLVGLYDGHGATTQTEFIWGTAVDSLSNSTGFVAQTTTSGEFSAPITGLTPGTKYYYQAVAENAGGTINAPQILHFTTAIVAADSCAISAFTADNSSLVSGSSTTLRWTTTNCASGTIDNGIGNATPIASGSIATGTLTGTTTYTLSAYTGPGASAVTASVTVTVGGVSSGCSIPTFYASPSVVSSGASTVLYWTMTSGCTSAWISNGIGTINPGSASTSGQTGTPALYSSTNYTLTAADRNGIQTTNTISVTVNSFYNYGCSINSFTASPSSISNGQNTTLSWSTYGCSGVSISGGNFYGQVQPLSGSIVTGALTGTTTYTLYANGNLSTSQQVTVFVSNSPYPYYYQCQNGNLNDPSCQGQYAGSVITTATTNVGGTTARLNGLANGANGQITTYFEYGTTQSLGLQTSYQNLGLSGLYNFYDTISTVPDTTYYYRAVGIINGITVRGNIVSFSTLGGTIDQGTTTKIIYVGGSSASPAATSGISLLITDGSDIVHPNSTVNYAVTYQNATTEPITNAVVNIVLPQGFSATATTQGLIVNPTMITATLGTILPNQTNTINITATVAQAAITGQAMVTTGTLSYTLSTGLNDSVVGTAVNHMDLSALQQNSLAGFAFGAGFFPNSAIGWVVIFFIILAIILVARNLSRKTPTPTNTNTPHH